MGLMSPRVRIAHVVVLAGVLALLAGALPGLAAAESCPNEEIRVEQGAGRLPDCRAFELVTPEVKGDDSSIGSNWGSPYSFPDGNHVYYRSLLAIPGARSGELQSVLSTRTASGWANTALTPSAGPGEPIGLQRGDICGGCYAGVAAFTGDFSAAFVNSGFDTDPLDHDGTVDAYRFDVSSGASSLAALPDTGPITESLNSHGGEPGTFVAGVSEDGSHVFFQTFDQWPVAPTTPSEHAGDMLYDRTGGQTYAVGVLPDGTISQTCSVELGNGPVDASAQGVLTEGAISPDGTNVVFTQAATEHCLSPGVYLRENNARTVKLPGTFYLRRSDGGAKIITAGNGAGIYEYDVASGTTTTITTEGNLVAASADGSRVYYLVGATGEAALTTAQLYVWDKGTSTLIPNVGEGFASRVMNSGASAGPSSIQPDTAVATPDGSKLLLLDRADLTGYNSFGPSCTNTEPSRPGLCAEAYIYDATNGSVTCVSCSPSGAPPSGNAHLMGVEQPNVLLPGYSEGEISPDGSRAFFETPDPLVPQDTNGLPDVYEWENGQISLISSGQGTYGSNFAGASSNGNDVFLVTTDHLLPQDIESATQIYDARVDGGFPYRPSTTGCDSGQCQGPQTPAPSFGAPASATFVGLGNPLPAAPTPAVKAKPKKCHKGFVARKHKCVRKKPSKTAKRASANRGAKSHA